MFSTRIFGEGMTGWHLAVEFFLAAVIVILAGAKLTSLADEISDRLHLPKGWIGALLLATVTSMPEVVTSGTAVLLHEPKPDLAFGNIFGSCCFNLVIITILNGIVGRGSILRRAEKVHSLSAACGIILLSLAFLGFAIPKVAAPLLGSFSSSPHLGLKTFEWTYCGLIALTYLLCMRSLYRFDRNAAAAPSNQTREEPGARTLYAKVSLNALVIIAAAIWLTNTGDVLAVHPFQIAGRSFTFGATFVGAFFLAVATSLPELTTSISAMRIGHMDLALGNIFGSNMFNIFVIPIVKCVSIFGGLDLLFSDPGDPVERTKNVLAGGLAMLLTGIVLVSLIQRSKRRIFGMGADSLLIGLVYIAGMSLLLTGG